jgi:hypothetical protein
MGSAEVYRAGGRNFRQVSTNAMPMSPAPQTETLDQKIKATALDLLNAHPGGMKPVELQKLVLAKDPSLKPKVVEWVIWELSKDSSKVHKPAKGILTLTKYASSPLPPEGDTPAPASSKKEASFYEPFAEWLVGAGDEATEAVVIGGAVFKAKWATPDVIGVYKAKPSDPIKFFPELVSAEIKTNATQSIIAFGQAISYGLFSHKTILAMPSDIEKLEEDNARLKSLCDLFGVGYVLFEMESLADPNFRFVAPPRRFEPDMFYVNSFARRLLAANKQHFDKLFQ